MERTVKLKSYTLLNYWNGKGNYSDEDKKLFNICNDIFQKEECFALYQEYEFPMQTICGAYVDEETLSW